MERLTINEIIEHCDRKTEMYEKACDIKYLETAVMGNGIKEYWEHKQVAEYLRKLKAYESLEEQGRLVILPCKVGDTVKRGQKIAVLEAMKMENNINADRDGKILEVKVNKGDSVLEGADIVVIG